MNIFQDIETIGADVLGFFQKAPQAAQDVLAASNKFLNTIKVLEQSAPAQTIIDLGEAFFPATTCVVAGAEAILSELLNITSETPGQVLLQATQAALGKSGVAKVAALNSIGTAIASAANSASNGTLTPQQIVGVIQLVHNPNTLSPANAAVSQAPIAPTPSPATA
jgi:hypothetical protein